MELPIPRGFAGDVFRLPAQAECVGAARRQVRATLSRWGLPRLCDDAGLVVTELFTNAVLHSDSDHVTCALWARAGLLHVEVTDQGDGNCGPAVREAGDAEENGRGLVLVNHVAQQWGVRHPGPDACGRTVWAALACGGVATHQGARLTG
jgi:anti-sigma regulatory factor (Ser/Thr protein kinase)